MSALEPTRQNASATDAVRALHGSTDDWCLLELGEQQTVFRRAAGQDRLAIGSHKTALAHFRHFPPTAVEMELAIMTVEDALASLRLPAGLTLYCGDALAWQIARLAGIDPASGTTVSIAAVEQVFERVAMMALGHPALLEGLPEHREFAAGILILRELMHHMGFESLRLLS
jgi:exopolyphosphatase/pppGpp-phosphohydrolase